MGCEMTTPDIDWAAPKRRRAQPAPRPAVACVVCGLRAGVLLCRECAEAPQKTRAIVRAWLDANIVQGRAALDAWDAVRQPRQAAWDKIEDSRQNDPPYAHACKCAEHVKKGNVYGQLLDAHDAYERAAQALQAERNRLEKALGVIDENL